MKSSFTSVIFFSGYECLNRSYDFNDMKTIITVKTGKGEASTTEDVERTFKEAMQIAAVVRGNIVGEKFLKDGAKVVMTR